MRGIGIKEPAAIGAQHLDRDLRRYRPDSDGLLGTFERRRLDIGPERLRHALPDEKERRQDADGHEHVKRAARDIYPEVADGLHRVTRKTANERNGEYNARRRRQIVLMCQAEHLREVRQRALAAVVLPIGVGDEADRRVEGEIRRDRRLLGRIERQARLEAHQRIENEKSADMEKQHADRVGQPPLLAFLVDTCRAVEDQLDRPQNRGQKRALAVEDARHIGAEHRGDRHDDRAIKKNLNPADNRHDTEPCCSRTI